MPDKIIVVEDQPAISAFVQTALEREGFTVEVIEDGWQALACIRQSRPDLVILDIMLPGVNGLEVCRVLRQMPTYVPVIMLTARDDDVDKVVGLELGADDYITKPFNTRELIARVRAVLRLARSRAAGGEPEHLRIDRLEIDLTGRTVTMRDQPVDLTPKEFDLLVLLASHPGRVFGRETLLERVWGYDYLGDSRTVDVHIQRLRRKLEEDPRHPRYLLTVRSIGYKFAKR
ncbi:MAG: response regulator transcription factor [Anaerolineae bacterium]|nr:response regulator transcription factor [Anaerolineae bacterium]